MALPVASRAGDPSSHPGQAASSPHCTCVLPFLVSTRSLCQAHHHCAMRMLMALYVLSCRRCCLLALTRVSLGCTCPSSVSRSPRKGTCGSVVPNVRLCSAQCVCRGAGCPVRGGVGGFCPLKMRSWSLHELTQLVRLF